MGKPTLLVPGNLVGSAGRAYPNAVPIDYIINRIRREMSEFGGKSPMTLGGRVFIIRSETGSGKSTVLPAYIFRLLRSEKTESTIQLTGPGVICTQPRILTAQTIARDQSADEKNYPDLVMGVTIGYQTGPLNEKPVSGLIYATAGSLLAQLRTMPDSDIMARYRFIIVDEAHERSHDIDALLMRLKIFLKRNIGNPRLPFVILASATLSVSKYSAYFGVEDDNIIEVRGRAFGVETRWPQVGSNNYLKDAVQIATEIHEQNLEDPPEKADILIFLPGKSEIKQVVDSLTKVNWKYRAVDSKVPPFLILAIYGEVIISEGRDYRLIKEAPKDLPSLPSLDGKTFLRPFRRMIVSTVVAETGLTIETLKYVVDCGWSRTGEIYYPGRYQGLITRPAPRSRIEQRKGRAGRKFPGVFYPLYTKNVYEALPVEQLPDIVMEGAGPIFLDIIKTTAEAAALRRQSTADEAQIFRVEDIDMLDPPPVDALAAALEESIVFGYLRFVKADVSSQLPAGHVLTRLGEVAGRFTYLRMHHVQTLLAAYLWRVSLRDLALIVALYDQRDALLYMVAPPGKSRAEEDENARQKALRAGLPAHLLGSCDDVLRARLLISDDFIEALLAFEGFVRVLDNAKGDLPRILDWCDENGISFEGVTFLASLRDAVMNEMLAAGLNPFWGDTFRLADTPPETFLDVVSRLKHCIYAGLRFSLLTYDLKTGAYYGRGGDRVEAPQIRSKDTLSRLRALDVKEKAIEGIAHPRRIVSNTVRLRGAKAARGEKFPPLLYRLQPGMVSVLDGYVNIDAAEFGPRHV